MTDNFKTAFSGIHAEDALKANTVQFLRAEIQKRQKTGKRAVYGRVAVAAMAALLLSGIFTAVLYLTPIAYVDVDINPSVALTLNRFDRVIGARAYNEDGESVLAGLSLKHKLYGSALTVLMESLGQHGYLQGLVSVTLQTNDAGKESELLTNLQTDVARYIDGSAAQMDVFPVSGDIKLLADELEISPAKYIAIQDLLEVDPTVSWESCRDHSISEIKQQTREHSSHHGEEDEVASSNSNHQNEDENLGGSHDKDKEGDDFETEENHHGCGHH